MKKNRFNLHASPASLGPDTPRSEELDKKEIKDLIGLTEKTKRFWGKTIVIISVIIIVNLMWFSGKIPLDNWFIAIINFLLISALVARYLHGEPDWDFNSKMFTASLIVVLLVLGIANLEKKRTGSTVDVNIVQKTYNGIIDWFNDDAEASIPKNARNANYRIYPPGTYTFSLKAGEMTDHWIMFPYGRKGGNHYSLSSTDFKYQILYDDGEKYDCWKIKSFPKKLRAKFKIIAVTNQPKLEMVVK